MNINLSTGRSASPAVAAGSLDALGLSVTKAAALLGMRRATLSDLVNGKAGLSPEMALRVEKAFGVSIDMLLRMQAWWDSCTMRDRADSITVRRYAPEKAEAAPQLRSTAPHREGGPTALHRSGASAHWLIVAGERVGRGCQGSESARASRAGRAVGQSELGRG